MFKFIHNIRKRISKSYREKVRLEELERKLRNAGFFYGDVENIQAIINALRELRADAVVGKLPFEQMGICMNLAQYTRKVKSVRLMNTVKIVCNFAYGWKHHNGNHSYPVPEDVEIGLWEGKNRILRLDLIDYVISELGEASLVSETHG